ncbi:hypothetical protein AB7M63_007732 [Bradyrhizobium japonicum]
MVCMAIEIYLHRNHLRGRLPTEEKPDSALSKTNRSI